MRSTALRFGVGLIAAVFMLSVTVLGAGSSAKNPSPRIRPADWSKICENRGHPRPACRKECQQSGPATNCNVYCNDGYKIGRCQIGVSCPGNTCGF
jgi:hypothetical protein